MKINDVNRVSGVHSYQKQNELRAEGTKKTRQKDQVQISAAAKEMLSTSQLNGTERAQRVHDLKQAVSTGSYHVEAGKIAEKLLPYLK